MTHIAVLGLGAMGSRMAARLLAAGHQLTVWNRSPGAADALVAAGATLAPTPRAAAQGADVLLSMLRDDDVSRHIWLDPETGAMAGMGRDALAIESSTLTPDWVRDLAGAMADKGIALLEAPVSGSLPAAESGQLVFLLGGSQEAVARAKPLLDVMGCSAHHLGAAGSAALAKLATNTMLGLHVAAWAEIIAMLRHGGADVEASLKALSATAIWAPVDHYLTSSMIAENFTPLFPVTMLEKDFAYALGVAGGAGRAPVVDAVHGRLKQAIDAGLGGLNMTGLVKLGEG